MTARIGVPRVARVVRVPRDTSLAPTTRSTRNSSKASTASSAVPEDETESQVLENVNWAADANDFVTAAEFETLMLHHSPKPKTTPGRGRSPSSKPARSANGADVVAGAKSLGTAIAHDSILDPDAEDPDNAFTENPAANNPSQTVTRTGQTKGRRAQRLHEADDYWDDWSKKITCDRSVCTACITLTPGLNRDTTKGARIYKCMKCKQGHSGDLMLVYIKERIRCNDTTTIRRFGTHGGRRAVSLKGFRAESQALDDPMARYLASDSRPSTSAATPGFTALDGEDAFVIPDSFVTPALSEDDSASDSLAYGAYANSGAQSTPTHISQTPASDSPAVRRPNPDVETLELNKQLQENRFQTQSLQNELSHLRRTLELITQRPALTRDDVAQIAETVVTSVLLALEKPPPSGNANEEKKCATCAACAAQLSPAVESDGIRKVQLLPPTQPDPAFPPLQAPRHPRDPLDPPDFPVHRPVMPRRAPTSYADATRPTDAQRHLLATLHPDAAARLQSQMIAIARAKTRKPAPAPARSRAEEVAAMRKIYAMRLPRQPYRTIKEMLAATGAPIGRIQHMEWIGTTLEILVTADFEPDLLQALEVLGIETSTTFDPRKPTTSLTAADALRATARRLAHIIYNSNRPAVRAFYQQWADETGCEIMSRDEYAAAQPGYGAPSADTTLADGPPDSQGVHPQRQGRVSVRRDGPAPETPVTVRKHTRRSASPESPLRAGDRDMSPPTAPSCPPHSPEPVLFIETPAETPTEPRPLELTDSPATAEPLRATSTSESTQFTHV